MKIILDLPNYDGNALDVIWEEGSTYLLEVNGNSAILKANNEGLISFAKQMLYLAYNNLPKGAHIHFDGFFTKNTDSEFTIVKDQGNTGDGSMCSSEN